MPSAKTVAQKPAGNLSPLSSLGHATLARCASMEGDWVAAHEAPARDTPNRAITDPRILHGREENTVESPRGLDTREPCARRLICLQTSYLGTLSHRCRCRYQ